MASTSSKSLRSSKGLRLPAALHFSKTVGGDRSSSPASGVSRDTTDFAGHNQAVFYITAPSIVHSYAYEPICKGLYGDFLKMSYEQRNAMDLLNKCWAFSLYSPICERLSPSREIHANMLTYFEIHEGLNSQPHDAFACASHHPLAPAPLPARVGQTASCILACAWSD